MRKYTAMSYEVKGPRSVNNLLSANYCQLNIGVLPIAHSTTAATGYEHWQIISTTTVN